jgi:RNA polymerase sigma factor (sigma-70 family)
VPSTRLAGPVRTLRCRVYKRGRLPDQLPAGEDRFEHLVLRHLDAAYLLARFLIREPSEIEDVLQDAVLHAIQYFHTLRTDADARAWFLTIVRRECYSTWTQRRGRRNTVSLDSVAEDGDHSTQLADSGELPDGAAERSSVREKIMAAVEGLPDRLREVIVLRELQQCSYEEIAMIIDAPIGTVMSRLSRGRACLAAGLRDVVDL